MKKSAMFMLMYLICMSAIFAQAEFFKPKTSVPDNKDEMIGKAEAFLNGMFEGNLESVEALMHDDFYDFPVGGNGQDSLSKEEALKEMAGFSKVWEDAKWNGISTCVKDESLGNTVVFLWGQASAKQAESGKEISFMNHAVYVFREGKIIRVYHYYDTATIGKQLGMKMVPAE